MTGAKPETALVAAIRDALAALPDVLFVVRVQSGKVKVRGGWMKLADEGTPDLMGSLRNGVHLEAEVKRPGEKTNAAQDLHLASSRAAGACAFVATSPEQAVAVVHAFTRNQEQTREALL